MRRSQAPSLRCGTKCLGNSQQEYKKTCSAPSHAVRSTDSVLNLLLEEAGEDRASDGGTGEHPVLVDAQLDTISVELQVENGIASEPLISADPASPENKIFNVVYCKQSTRKHKVWEGDGTLEVRGKHLTLKDENGKILGTSSFNKSKTVEEGSHVFVGSKEVEVIELVNEGSKLRREESSPVNKVVKKRKINPSGKKFIIPLATPSGENGGQFVLPEPNAEHQWEFNKNGLPVTQVCIDSNLSRNLRQHQCIGITFLYECIMGFKAKNINGAILADEMGLGKTLQTITLIWTLLRKGPYGNRPVLKKVLVVTPSSLTMNWYNEFIKWLGRERLVPYVVDSKRKPARMTGPVMIISYEMFVRCFEEMKELTFDLLVCDEGHRLKNGNVRAAQLLQRLDCRKRILLTGTPIQNDLREFYTLVDFVNPNSLGSPSEFRRCFEEPILASRDPSADEESVSAGEERAGELNRRTSLFLLRRTKDVLDNYLPSKSEIVVFCRATDIQLEIYNYLINSLMDNNEGLFGPCDGSLHLGVIACLKKVCNHPGLLWSKDSGDKSEDVLLSKLSNKFGSVEGTSQPEMSSKLTVVLNFLCELRERFPKERVVIVSNSTQTLDLLEKNICELRHSTCRLDGSVPTAQRNRIVDGFNRSQSSAFVFLLSSKAGGVGLNLTGASRLILYDSDWNPANDLQAMSRIWRDGQKVSVYIYRLLTSGTIEEKIYQRQINKQGLCEGIVDRQRGSSIKLSREEAKDIFSFCDDRGGCLTHEALSCKCSKTGEIPVIEEEERACQLMRQSNASLKMNELFHWEHHGSPLSPLLLSELCLLNSKNFINFIFRSCKR